MNMNATQNNIKGCRMAIYNADTQESVYEYFFEKVQDITPHIDPLGEKI